MIVTFCLVSSLFLLWGLCNGMIDTMDKHFQDELHLKVSQSAWIQFAHYTGYFLMSLPAGWLTLKLGYKGGIISGLLLVAAGGLWFVPATMMKSFLAVLLGVCALASGLTFLETVANPYTTVLGSKRFAATRINMAQSCNGIGWILGPIVGAKFFYGTDAQGKSTGSQTLWIPYVAIAGVGILLIVAFIFTYMPDLKAQEDDQPETGGTRPEEERQPVHREVRRGTVFFLLISNAAVLIGIVGMLSWVVLNACSAGSAVVGIASVIPHPSSLDPLDANNGEHALALVIAALGCLALIPTGIWIARHAKAISRESIWSHPHFCGATLAQFFYVAAQAGIFSFLINYMTSAPPPIPDSLHFSMIENWYVIGDDGLRHISNQGAAYLSTVAFCFFLAGRVSGSALLAKFSAHKVVGLFAVVNVAATLLVFLDLGWLSVACVFLSYFFMSIMFPTIFALGIHDLGFGAKRASAYIVMAIMGGAILPKVMGAVAEAGTYKMARGFIVPLVCFVIIALYGLAWPRLSGVSSLHGVAASRGH